MSVEGTEAVQHSATDFIAVVRRVKEFLDPSLPWRPTDEDADEELLALHIALRGINKTEDKGVIGLLRDLCNDTDLALNRRLPRRSVQMEGVEVEKSRPSHSEWWDHKGAAEEIAVRAFTAAAVENDGELTASAAVDAVVNAFLKCAHVDYWRMTAGEKFEAQLWKFREKGELQSPAGVVVRIPKKEKAE